MVRLDGGHALIANDFLLLWICSGSRCPSGEYCNNKNFQRVSINLDWGILQEMDQLLASQLPAFLDFDEI